MKIIFKEHLVTIFVTGIAILLFWLLSRTFSEHMNALSPKQNVLREPKQPPFADPSGRGNRGSKTNTALNYIAKIVTVESVDFPSPKNPHDLVLVGQLGPSARVIRSDGKEVWRHPEGKRFMGMDLSESGELAKFSYYSDPNSPLFEIYRLPVFELVSYLEDTDFTRQISWRWLDESRIVGHKNSSGRDHALRPDEKSEIYIFDIVDRNISGPIEIPKSIPAQFEMHPLGVDSIVKVEAMNPDGSEFGAYIIFEPKDDR